jgi:hypothetical protein
MIKHLFLIQIIFVSIIGCQSDLKSGNSEIPPSHKQFTQILQKYVKGNLVDYKGLQKDSLKLIEYLDLLNNTAPDKVKWTKNQQLAYWINTYNAFTLKLIIDNYPLRSITNLHPTIYIPMVNTVWHKKIFIIGGEKISLDQIEHDILRKKFNEPRIHFAINCSSISCPPLRAEAFISERLDQQLDEQARLYINDQKRNHISSDLIEISKIFSWFSKDFTKNESLVEYLNKYSQIKINDNATIEYLDYNWNLNDYK